MVYQTTKVKLIKDKSIGKVLFIVEGSKTEPYILHKIFTKIFDYQFESILREKPYKIYNSKVNHLSSVFVINANESNILNINKDNEFLNNLFSKLIEDYDFDIDNCAIYYIWDRDSESNKDVSFINELLQTLINSRDNGYLRQGLLLFNYPSIESFTLSNFHKSSFNEQFLLGDNLKTYLHKNNYNHQKITDETILHATKEMIYALNFMNIYDYNLDNFKDTNLHIFDYEENAYSKEQLYNALSLLVISLLDLGLIEIE